MTNFHDPKTEQADALAFVKLLHVVGGIYIWEYVTTFGFEWQIITGKRKYRWTILLYSGCRLSALLAVIVIFIGFNVTTEINCKLWLIFVFTTAYSAFVFASALIVLRIIAIWERNKVVSAIAIGAWLTNIAFYIHNIATANSAWSPEQQTCLLLDSHRSEANTIVTLIEDFVLLGLMLLGLRRYGNAGMFGGLWRLLYRQGLLWLIVVTLAEIPPTVFIILNLNDYFNLMFQTPELIMMAVGASRIYRSLADYTTMTEFNWDAERSHFAPASGSATLSAPTTMRFRETIQLAPTGSSGSADGGGKGNKAESFAFDESQDAERTFDEQERTFSERKHEVV